MPVSAVLLTAISASTMMNGIDSAPSSQCTPNQSCAIHTPNAPTMGMPIQDTGSGSSTSLSTSEPGAAARRRPVRPRNASTNTSGRANSATIAATTIMVMPHQSDQVLRMCARPNSAVPSAIAPARGWISPSEIMIGTTITKLSTAPMSRLTAVRMPISPPAPIMAKSSVGDSASWRMSTPASFGSGIRPFSTRA